MKRADAPSMDSGPVARWPQKVILGSGEIEVIPKAWIPGLCAQHRAESPVCPWCVVYAATRNHARLEADLDRLNDDRARLLKLLGQVATECMTDEPDVVWMGAAARTAVDQRKDADV